MSFLQPVNSTSRGLQRPGEAKNRRNDEGAISSLNRSQNNAKKQRGAWYHRNQHAAALIATPLPSAASARLKASGSKRGGACHAKRNSGRFYAYLQKTNAALTLREG